MQTVFVEPWASLDTDSGIHVDEVNGLPRAHLAHLSSIGQVGTTLMHLKPKKATGTNKIPAWLLKRFCDDLAFVVHNIIVQSIRQGKYPFLYKHDLITPIAKVRSPRDTNNDFRQISVLPQLSKVLEKIQLLLNSHDLQVKDNQHAFIQGRSTVSALISTTQRWYDATDNMKLGRKGIHAIFIDFKKAFDLVNHTILLQKLSFMNITRDFWLWIQSFLTGRSQQVNICGRLSSIASCPLGVPQGSIISPSLFNVHINDLEDGIPNYLNIDACK